MSVLVLQCNTDFNVYMVAMAVLQKKTCLFGVWLFGVWLVVDVGVFRP